MKVPEDDPLEDVTGLRKRQALELGARVRVRRWAVMGTALVGMWAAGTGVASATDGEGLPLPTSPGCEDIATITGYGEGEGEWPPPCDTELSVWVDVDGDCDDPETFTFYVDAEGLIPSTDYYVSFTSEAFEPTSPDIEPEVELDFTADEDGYGYAEVEVEEGDGIVVTSGAFTVQYDVFDDDARSRIDSGVVEVGACETTPPTTTPPTTTAPVTHEPAAPTTTAPATTTVAPVVVHPAAAAPAVLANTGAPVTAAALLGGGLLVAGAGALVATRRRAS